MTIMRIVAAVAALALGLALVSAGATSARAGDRAPSPGRPTRALDGMDVSAAASTWPDSMAAIGDSFSAAFNAHPVAAPDPSGCPNGRGPFGDPSAAGLPAAFGLDCPANSWSTGDNPQIHSIYQRILARNPRIAGHAANFATTAVSVSDLARQATLAAAAGAELVTVTIGINDACDPFGIRGGHPTPLDTFADQFGGALGILAGGRAHPRILIATIPNGNRTWALFHGDPNALVRWQFPQPPGVICPPLLANPASTAPADVSRRAAFLARIAAYNLIQASVCSKTPRCQTDGGALFTWQFGAQDIATVTNTGGVDAVPFNLLPLFGAGALANSTGDYWHPTRDGQAAIAELEWSAAKLGD
jgi:lysophospholipase L1-like esterase